MNGRDPGELPLAQTLTEREQEVLTYIGDGLTNRDIAEKITVALSTVKWYVRQIYNKLGVENREQAVARGRRLGLVAPEAKPRHNLPPQPTPFIGRQEEITTLTRMLADPDCRLLTITGPGGMGKTRLALTVGKQYVVGAVREPPLPDGIFFVSLASLSAATQIATALATALDYPLEAGRQPRMAEAQITDYLRRKQMLLTLDNYEHLLPDTTWLASLLQAAPQLKILVTSRERLNLQEEYLFPLDGLTYPDGEQIEDQADDPLTTFTAFVLFAAAARRRQADYEIKAAELPLLRQLCRLVEGLPLALELAAGRLDVLPLATIVSELQQDVGLLVTQVSNMPPRHRHIFAAFEATWQGLTEAEQTIFAGLSIFRGGFTRQTAWQVCAPQMDQGAFWLALSKLSGKSLIRYHPEADRYDLHELLRQFGAEKLETLDATDTCDKHFAYFLAWVEALQSELLGKGQAAALGQLESEYGNVQVALSWSAQDKQRVEAGLKLATALDEFWRAHGHAQEGRDWFMRLRTQADVSMSRSVRAKALLIAARLELAFGQDAIARPLLDESLALYQQMEDEQGIAEALLFLGRSARHLQQWESAKAYYLESLLLFKAVANNPGMAQSYHQLGRWAEEQQDWPAARVYFEDSMALFCQMGDRKGIAANLKSLGVVAMAEGDLEQTRRYLEEARSMFQALGMIRGVALTDSELGELARLEGDYERAASLYNQALPTFQKLGLQFNVEITLYNLGMAALQLGDKKRADTLLREILSVEWEERHSGLLLACVGGLGGVALARGDVARAVRLLAAVTAWYEAPGSSIDAVLHKDFERFVTTVRARLDEATFAVAWVEGQALTIEGAIAYALEESKPFE